MRKAFLLFILVLATMAFLVSCQTIKEPSSEDAAAALQDFFTYLNSGQYVQADELYAGSYETLISWNPDVDPEDHAALWERGCTFNGLQCLEAESVILNDYRGGVFFFKVSFTAADGGTFVRGPCCGATEEEMPSTSVFDYSVIYVNGRYQVVNPPVYTP